MMIGSQVSGMNLKKIKVLMAKCHKIRWIPALFRGAFLLLAPIMISSVLAEVLHSAPDSKILECQTALEKFSFRLEERSRGRPHQAYYANLYRQTQDFLASLKNFPTPPLDKCQNYLNVVQDIVGGQGADLGPLPRHSGQRYGGRLTQPILKTIPKRELRNIRYEYAERARSAKEKKQIGEEEEDLEEVSFAPTPVRRSTKTGNPLASETKDHEPKF
jgi:hypothetical protein